MIFSKSFLEAKGRIDEKDKEFFITKTENHILGVRERIDVVRSNLEDRGDAHDSSKFDEPELSVYSAYTKALADAEYMSDEYKELLEKIKPATGSHFSKNSHHPEFFTNGISGMNLMDLIEFVSDCHQVSGGGNDGMRTMELNKDKFQVDDQLWSVIMNTFRWLDENKK